MLYTTKLYLSLRINCLSYLYRSCLSIRWLPFSENEKQRRKSRQEMLSWVPSKTSLLFALPKLLPKILRRYETTGRFAKKQFAQSQYQIYLSEAWWKTQESIWNNVWRKMGLAVFSAYTLTTKDVDFQHRARPASWAKTPGICLKFWAFFRKFSNCWNPIAKSEVAEVRIIPRGSTF